MRGDQTDVGGGAGTRDGARVHERRLDERASLSVGAARTGLEVGNRANERTIDGIGASRGEHGAVLAAERGLSTK